MNRAAVGALLISLVAGSAATAGTVLPPGTYGDGNRGRQERQHRPDNRHDDRGRHDNNHRNDHRGDGHRNDRRDDHRRDGHRNDRRDDHRRGDNHNFRGRDDHRWNDSRRDHDRHRDYRRDDRRDYRHDNRHNYGHDHRRWDDHRGHYNRPTYRYERGRYHWGHYHRPHGYVARHWVRGHRLPRAYYGPTYVIHNYDHCGLRRPPYGYHWVRVDHDAVLAVIATGVILDVVYNQFW
jgi:Ni/Co efflux regulator RcnB